MQKATVTASQPTGQWNDLYKFEVTLSDGASGLVFSKSPQLRFGIGEEVEYEVPTLTAVATAITPEALALATAALRRTTVSNTL